MPIMNDAIIRNSLIEFLKQNKKDPESIVVSEMGLDGGRAIMDVALINGKMCGYEIKSDIDSLYRLDSQIDVYEKYFQELNVVTTKKHLKNVRTKLPQWVGLILVIKDEQGVISLKVTRKPKLNTRVKKSELTKLMWKNEAQSFLRAQGVKGFSTAPRKVLWEQIAETTTQDELVRQIKFFMTSRSGWQVVV